MTRNQSQMEIEFELEINLPIAMPRRVDEEFDHCIRVICREKLQALVDSYVRYRLRSGVSLASDAVIDESVFNALLGGGDDSEQLDLYHKLDAISGHARRVIQSEDFEDDYWYMPIGFLPGYRFFHFKVSVYLPPDVQEISLEDEALTIFYSYLEYDIKRLLLKLAEAKRRM